MKIKLLTKIQIELINQLKKIKIKYKYSDKKEIISFNKIKF